METKHYKKKSEEKSGLLEPAEIRDLRLRFESLVHAVARLPWVCQGSVMHTPPNAYRWTRKVNKKTVTVSLSKDQAELIMEAIAHHRKLETMLKTMRELSERALLGSAPGVVKRRNEKSSQNPLN
jgi:hypothetical protein